MGGNFLSTVQPGEMIRFLDALRDDCLLPALRLLPGRRLRENLEQFFINKGLVRTEEGRIKFKPSIARIYRTAYGWHIILKLFPGLSPEDIAKNICSLEYAAGGECKAFEDNSGWIHVKVYTRHLPGWFGFVPDLAARIRKYPLAIPVGISRQGLVILKLFRDEEFALLVAGMPGWGKSVFLRQALTSVVLAYEPDQVELYLIDMKRGVEFSPFHHVPHTRAWAGDLPGARRVLAGVLNELNRRAGLIEGASVTNITEYNKVRPKGQLPHIILAVDEYGSLGTGEKDTVTEICQKGRFAGVHPVLCTQRPTTDVLPGQTKALLPCIICFRMSSKANSRYVLGDECSEAAYLEVQGRAVFQRGDWPREVQVMNLQQTEARRLICQKYPVTSAAGKVVQLQSLGQALVP